MSTQVKIDFYRVTMPPDAAGTFEDALAAVDGSADDESRNLPTRGGAIRLRKANRESDHWDADMTRIRMDDLPRKAKLSGGLEDLDFDDDEGVGEETAFLYIPSTRVLVHQRNRFGVSASAIGGYFGEMRELAGPITLEPILLPVAMERLNRIGLVRKFDFKLAALENPEALRDENRSVSDAIALLNAVNAPHLSVSLSMGHQPGSLSVREVVKMAKALFRISGLKEDGPGEDVERIRINAKMLDGDTEVIDLIDFRMQEIENVETNRRRRITYSSRRDALRRAWDKHREELRRMFAPQRRGQDDR